MKVIFIIILIVIDAYTVIQTFALCNAAGRADKISEKS